MTTTLDRTLDRARSLGDSAEHTFEHAVGSGKTLAGSLLDNAETLFENIVEAAPEVASAIAAATIPTARRLVGRSRQRRSVVGMVRAHPVVAAAGVAVVVTAVVVTVRRRSANAPTLTDASAAKPPHVAA